MPQASSPSRVRLQPCIYKIARGEENLWVMDGHKALMTTREIGESIMLHVKDAHYISGFRVALTFSDGTAGIADLKQHLKGPIFEPLKHEDYFKQLRFDPMLGTIVWPNGADLAPEFLHRLICPLSVS